MSALTGERMYEYAIVVLTLEYFLLLLFAVFFFKDANMLFYFENMRRAQNYNIYIT